MEKPPYPESSSSNRLIYHEIQRIHELFMTPILTMDLHKIYLIYDWEHWMNKLEVENDKFMLDFPNWEQTSFDGVGVEAGNEIQRLTSHESRIEAEAFIWLHITRRLVQKARCHDGSAHIQVYID